MEADVYLSLKGRSEGLFKSKGSKHFGYAVPVNTEVDVKEFIESLKVEHHSARQDSEQMTMESLAILLAYPF